VSDKFTLKNSKGLHFAAIKVTGTRVESTASSGGGYLKVVPSYELSDGRLLKYDHESDIFEIVVTGEKLMRALAS
jgi:hypothetical protein